MKRLILYGRRDCHLCQAMRAVVEEVGRRFPVAIEEVDIDRDPALQAEWGTAIPVLWIDGQEAFRYHVTAQALQRRLRE